MLDHNLDKGRKPNGPGPGPLFEKQARDITDKEIRDAVELHACFMLEQLEGGEKDWDGLKERGYTRVALTQGSGWVAKMRAKGKNRLGSKETPEPGTWDAVATAYSRYLALELKELKAQFFPAEPKKAEPIVDLLSGELTYTIGTLPETPEGLNVTEWITFWFTHRDVLPATPEVLASALRVTPQAIGNAIRALGRQGYKIEKIGDGPKMRSFYRVTERPDLKAQARAKARAERDAQLKTIEATIASLRAQLDELKAQ